MTSSGPKSNALCVFPFHFKGKFYESCTSAGHTQNWCATKVGSNDSYVENEWGNCNDNCAYEGRFIKLSIILQKYYFRAMGIRI